MVDSNDVPEILRGMGPWFPRFAKNAKHGAPFFLVLHANEDFRKLISGLVGFGGGQRRRWASGNFGAAGSRRDRRFHRRRRSIA
jgi:hypothetical protein